MVKSPRVARWCAALGRVSWQVAVGVCYSVLQCVSVCCGVLQCDTVCYGVASVFCKISLGGALVCSTGTGLVEGSCSSVLQSAAVYCGVPHCFAKHPWVAGVQHAGKSHSYRVV